MEELLQYLPGHCFIRLANCDLVIIGALSSSDVRILLTFDVGAMLLFDVGAILQFDVDVLSSGIVHCSLK